LKSVRREAVEHSIMPGCESRLEMQKIEKLEEWGITPSPISQPRFHRSMVFGGRPIWTDNSVGRLAIPV
jgi:hypothetical protein